MKLGSKQKKDFPRGFYPSFVWLKPPGPPPSPLLLLLRKLLFPHSAFPGPGNERRLPLEIKIKFSRSVSLPRPCFMLSWQHGFTKRQKKKKTRFCRAPKKTRHETMVRTATHPRHTSHMLNIIEFALTPLIRIECGQRSNKAAQEAGKERPCEEGQPCIESEQERSY